MQRLLIRTHHITSRAKIQKLTRAASRAAASVVLKTGSWPGVMLVEARGDGDGDGDGTMREWVGFVRSLRYKDFHIVKREEIEVPERGVEMGLEGLGIERGSVREFTDVRDLEAFLRGDERLFRWWRLGMGFDRDGGEGEEGKG